VHCRAQFAMEVTILLPMAGLGSRYADVGFLKPKPMIDVAGSSMISWVIDNIMPRAYDLKASFVGTCL
jgi:CTP:molybdopterin cytidylyltransferase MocA